MDGSILTPQVLLPVGSALVAVGAYLKTVTAHEKRITKLEEKDYCPVHHELCGMMRADLKYLRSRIDQIVNHLKLGS